MNAIVNPYSSLGEGENSINDNFSRLVSNQDALSYFLRQLGRKMQIKQSGGEDTGNDETEGVRRLGIFLLEYPCFTEDQAIQHIRNSGLDVYGDTLGQLHIPPQEIGSLGQVQRSFERVAKYLQAKKSRGEEMPKYLFGISSLAHVSKRYGFTLLDLPVEIQALTGAARVQFAGYKRDLKKTNPIQLCYISTEEFLKQFGERIERKAGIPQSEAGSKIGQVHDQLIGILYRLGELFS